MNTRLRPYEVVVNGIATVLLLTETDARKRGLRTHHGDDRPESRTRRTARRSRPRQDSDDQ